MFSNIIITNLIKKIFLKKKIVYQYLFRQIGDALATLLKNKYHGNLLPLCLVGNFERNLEKEGKVCVKR